MENKLVSDVKKYKEWLILATILVIAFIWCVSSIVSMIPVTHGPGIIAPNEPVQVNYTEKQKEFYVGKNKIVPVATFELKARVLHTCKYTFSSGASLIPYDIAFGWGRMSDEEVLKDIDISQSNRFYFWQTNVPPIPFNEIECSSANMHLISASKEIKKTISKLKRGHLVKLKGKLVNVTFKNGMTINSSKVRTDTGAGACEVIYVEEISIEE